MFYINLRFKRIAVFMVIIAMILPLFPVNVMARQQVVVINPGHSVGYDPGSTAYKVSEAEINEILAGRIVNLLNQQGYKVYITHTTDSSLSSHKLLTQAQGDELKDVAKAINEIDPDLTISIHHNSGGSSSSGSEIYWSSYRDFDQEGIYVVENLWGSGEDGFRDISPSPAAQKSKEFAQILKDKLNGSQIKFRYIVERDDYIPAHTTSPSVLYEGGYLSNPSEAAYIASEAYISDAASRIVNAVNQYFSSNSSGSGTTGSGGSTTTQKVTESTRIMGSSGTTSSQLVNFYNANAGITFPEYYVSRGVSLEQFAQMYIAEARAEGVREDLAFAQAMLETGFLKFGKDVKINQFNFAGIGATGNGAAGEDFAAQYGDNANGIRMGIRAQIQHLKAYGSTLALNNTCVDPRFSYVSRGSALTIGELTGKWASDPEYGSKIVELINQIPGTSQNSNSVEIYRLYNPINAEHLYTPDANEASVLSNQSGWVYEGVGWKAPGTGTPVYRLYSPVTGSHLFTTDKNEIAVLTSQSGWTVDNNGEPLFYSGGNNPIYRLYNEDLRQHHLTTDVNEYNILPSSGWRQEGVALQCN